jgi:hypothetical protein
MTNYDAAIAFYICCCCLNCWNDQTQYAYGVKSVTRKEKLFRHFIEHGVSRCSWSTSK